MTHFSKIREHRAGGFRVFGLTAKPSHDIKPDDRQDRQNGQGYDEASLRSLKEFSHTDHETLR